MKRAIVELDDMTCNFQECGESCENCKELEGCYGEGVQEYQALIKERDELLERVNELEGKVLLAVLFYEEVMPEEVKESIDKLVDEQIKDQK